MKTFVFSFFSTRISVVPKLKILSFYIHLEFLGYIILDSLGNYLLRYCYSGFRIGYRVILLQESSHKKLVVLIVFNWPYTCRKIISSEIFIHFFRISQGEPSPWVTLVPSVELMPSLWFYLLRWQLELWERSTQCQGRFKKIT